MTEVIASKEKNHYKIQAKNHAGSSEVCNGISAILYALEGALFNNDYVCEHISTLTPGNAEIAAVCLDSTAAEDFRMALIGIMQIQKAHPGEVGVSQNIF